MKPLLFVALLTLCACSTIPKQAQSAGEFVCTHREQIAALAGEQAWLGSFDALCTFMGWGG